MQRHRGLHGLALALVCTSFALLAGGASVGKATEYCLDPPPPPPPAYARGFTFSYIDPCNEPEYDWGVDPQYTDTPYASEAEAQAAEGEPGTVQVSVSLPTWQSLYDWPNGHGYSGWASATSAPEGAYGMQSALGGNHGLWLWATGGRQYGPGYAEWALTAPGTTRISKAQLS